MGSAIGSTNSLWRISFGLLLCTISASATAGVTAVTPNDTLHASYSAGYASLFSCSGVFTAGRELDSIRREELVDPWPSGAEYREDNFPPRVRPTSLVVNREAKAVSAYPAYANDPYFGGEPRIAVYRRGLGCTLLPPGSSLEDRSRLSEFSLAEPADRAHVPWPDGDRTEDYELPGEVSGSRLEQAMAMAFEGEKYQPHKTLAVVVVYQGRIIAERYAPGWNMHTQYRTWSTAKSIASAVIGVAVNKGLLELDQPVPIPEWAHPLDPRRNITLRHLLNMSSGLLGTGSNTPLAYWVGIDTARHAAASQLAHAPGSHWQYANYDTLLLMYALRSEIDNDDKYLRFPHEELFRKIGMLHTVPETDAWDNYIFSSQVYTTARDLARFGLLYLNGGRWGDEQVLPSSWIELTRTPSDLNGRYSLKWWHYNRNDALAKLGAFSTGGFRGQYATVVPGAQLVVVRTGLNPTDNSNWSQEEFVSDIIAAIDISTDAEEATSERKSSNAEPSR
ncbi:MAG: serine hydrolase [Woeseia sp.]